LTLRLRLTVWYVLLVAATLTVFSLLVRFGLARVLHHQFDVALDIEVRDQLASLRDTGSLGQTHRDDRPPPGLEVVFFDANANPPGRGLRPYPGMPRFASSGLWRYCTVPVAGRGFVQVYGSEQSLERSLAQLGWLLALAVPLTSLTTGAGGLFLASRALRPIDRITQTAAALGADDLSRRLPETTVPDEVGRLTSTFNGMLARLESSFEKQRQFTADAAHELRTPLALMLGRTELTLARERTLEEYRTALAEVHGETARLSRLVAKLLGLARGALALEFEPLDLQAIALDVAEVLGTGSVTIEVSGGPAPVRGDQTRLTELVLNLLDNAIKASPPNGVVTVRTGPGLEITDQGPGIAPEHLERIFERFYQVDPARSGSATGLGLAICRAIVQEHGGSLAVRSTVGSGSTFVVLLP
jgi:heavy metal sensor kinase